MFDKNVLKTHCVSPLKFPAIVALQAGDEGRHGLICRTRLHLVVVALGLALAGGAEHEDTRCGLLGIHRLLLLNDRLHNRRPTLRVEIYRS